MIGRSFRRAGLLALGLVGLSTSACFSMNDMDGPEPHHSYVQDWRDENIYQILVDRFANGDSSNDWGVRTTDLAHYQGGDWKGIEDHLDYLQELGITTLWISPIIKNVDNDASIDGYHGYWTQDLTQLNPHMGDLASLRSMVRAAHKRNMKVILDIVTNHMGQLFFYDMNRNGSPDEQVWGGGVDHSPIEHHTEYDPDYQEPYIYARTGGQLAGPAPIIFFHDAVYNHMPPVSGFPPNSAFDAMQDERAYHKRGRIYEWAPREDCCFDAEFGRPLSNECSSLLSDPRQQQLCRAMRFGDFPGGLKDVNTEWQYVRDAMVYAYTRWMDLVDFDGFRIDTLKHVEHEFWKDFCPRVREHAAKIGKQNFFMFGESFTGVDTVIGSYTAENEVDSAFYFSQKYEIYNVFQNGAPTQALKNLFDQRPNNYNTNPQPNGVGQPATKVLVNFLDNHDTNRVLFDNPSIPALHNSLLFLYTEDGIPCLYYGTEQQFKGQIDPSNRERLWDSKFDTKNATFRFISQLNALRQKYEPLRRGEMSYAFTTTDGPGLIAFERYTDKQRVLVVINPHDTEPRTETFRVGFDGDTQLVNVLNEEDGNDSATTVKVETPTEKYVNVTVTLGPRAGKIFVVQGQ